MNKEYLKQAMGQTITKGGTDQHGLISPDVEELGRALVGGAKEAWEQMKADHEAFQYNAEKAVADASGIKLKKKPPKNYDKADPSMAALDYANSSNPMGMIGGMLKGVHKSLQPTIRKVMREEFRRRRMPKTRKESYTEEDKLVDEFANSVMFRDYGLESDSMHKLAPVGKGTAYVSTHNLGEPAGISMSADPLFAFSWRGTPNEANRVLPLFGKRPSDAIVRAWKGSEHEELMRDAYAHAFGKMATPHDVVISPEKGKNLLEYQWERLNRDADAQLEFGKHMSDYLRNQGFEGVMYGVNRYKDQARFGEAEIRLFDSNKLVRLEKMRDFADKGVKRMITEKPVKSIPAKSTSKAMGKDIDLMNYFSYNKLKENFNAGFDKIQNLFSKASPDVKPREFMIKFNRVKNDQLELAYSLKSDLHNLQKAYEGSPADEDYLTRRLSEIDGALDRWTTLMDQVDKIRDAGKAIKQGRGKEKFPGMEDTYEEYFNGSLAIFNYNSNRAKNDIIQDLEGLANFVHNNPPKPSHSTPALRKYLKMTKDKSGSLSEIYKEITPEVMEQKLKSQGLYDDVLKRYEEFFGTSGQPKTLGDLY